MIAYELADELLRDNTQLTVKAAYMLRQQADRIAELEKLLEHSVGSDCREMRYIQEIENKDARIAELEQNLSAYIVELELHKAMIQDLERKLNNV